MYSCDLHHAQPQTHTHIQTHTHVSIHTCTCGHMCGSVPSSAGETPMYTYACEHRRPCPRGQPPLLMHPCMRAHVRSGMCMHRRLRPRWRPSLLSPSSARHRAAPAHIMIIMDACRVAMPPVCMCTAAASCYVHEAEWQSF